MSMTTLNTIRTPRNHSEDRTSRQDKTRTPEARTEARYRKQVRREKYGK